MAISGEYSGTIDGDPVTFVFTFLPGGVVNATVEPDDGPETTAAGTYRLEGSIARIELQDEGAATVSAYRGTIKRSSLSGQITLSTGEIRYFAAQRQW